MDDDFDIDDELLMEVASQADRHLEATKPSAQVLQCLQSNFGHNGFRPKQWDIIRSIVEEKRDNCVIMPTGYGKSLCFQFPAVYADGITLVISPLISLMQDQVSALSVANISACFLGSAQTDRNMEAQVIAGDYRMVYVSPEYVNGDKGQQLLKKLEQKLTLIAIDESHCISAFGHAFRPDYRKLGGIRKLITSVPILAVTATATQHVRDDIISSLRLKNAHCVSMGFDRPNIHFSFRHKSKNTWDDLKPFVTNVRGSVIVYVLTKNGCDDISAVLHRNGIQCEIYHAGLPMKKRRDVLDDFIKDRLKVIVATVAFGMGIDKPDVRCVIHYGASKNIESYYQEVGRAGRDGQPSRAITFHSKSDFGLHEYFLKENREHQSETVIQHLREIGAKMRDFCHTSMCRRKYLLEYFDSDASHIRPRSKCCDNCDSGSSRITLSDTYVGIDDDGNYDFTANAYLLLRAMQITNKVAVAISVLKGSCEKKALEFKDDKQIYGAGKIWPKEYWSHLVDQLKDYNYITLKKLPLPYRPIQVVSEKGKDWLKNTARERMVLKAKPEMYQYFKKKPKKIVQNIAMGPMPSNLPPVDASKEASKVDTRMEVEVDNYCMKMEKNDKHLEEILLGVRAVLAENSDCMPYLVATNTAIQQMVEKKPFSIKEFKSCVIDGFSIAKIDKFAAFFIDGIIKFENDEFSLSTLLPTYLFKAPASKFSSQEKRQLDKMLQSNQSLIDVSKQMSRSEQEVIDEIVVMIRTGLPITKTHLANLVGANDEILKYLKSNLTDDDLSKSDNVALVKEKFVNFPHITEQMLALVLHYLKVRQFLRSINVPFFDADENRLVNGHALLESKSIGQINSNASQSQAKASDGKLSSFGGESSSQRPNGSFSSSQNSQSSQVLNLLEEDEDDFAAIVANYDSKNDIAAAKPLHDSQKSNQNDEIKKFDAKPTKKVPLVQTKISSIGTGNGRKRPASKYQVIQYQSDSDSESTADNSEPQTKRALPQWMTTKKTANATSTKASSNPIRKKSFF